MHTIASRPIAEDALLTAEHAGRPTDRLGIDTVLADLHRLGAVRLEVTAELDLWTGETIATFVCSLVPRTGVGLVRTQSRCALDAALGCQLEALRELTAAVDDVERGFVRNAA